MAGKLVLIDGHSILFRAFYGIPTLTNSEGLHTNAVYGFLNIMFKILEEEKADHLAVAFDLAEPTFRHKMFDAYKGTRSAAPEEFHEQVPLMKEVLGAMGVPVMTLAGYEADDILGTLAKKNAAAGVEVSIVSGDRDLLQLADERIKIRIPRTSRGGTEIHDYYPADVKEKYLVTPAEFIDVKALMGDQSDNIPGVPSIGEKTATAIIAQYGSIENAFAHVDEIKPPRAQKALRENYDLAVLSKELATICTDCPIAYSYEDMEIGDLYTQEAYQFMKRLEFKSILARFDAAKMQTPGAKAEEKFAAVRDFAEVEKILARAKEMFKQAEAAGGKPGAGNADTGRAGAVGTDAPAVGAARPHLGIQLLIDGSQVTGLALCFGEEDSYVIAAEGFLTGEYLAGKAAELILASDCAVTIDLKSQLPYLAGVDYDSPAMDAGVAGYLLNPLKDTYEYDDLARDYLGMTVPSRTDLLGKQSVAAALAEASEIGTDTAGTGTETVVGQAAGTSIEADGRQIAGTGETAEVAACSKAETCACYMAYIAWKSAPVLRQKLEETGMWSLFTDIEMPLIYSLHHMEQAGVRVEKDALKKYGDDLKVQIGKLENEIYDKAGERFNINSTKQLGEILFEKMNLPHGKKTKTGYSTAADVLEKLAEDYPVVRMILDYRQLTKLNSTYAEGLAAFIREDGRIHGKFNQTITATGRISSTEPNLQNIPVRMELGRQIRKVFVPEDGYVFVDADYSQIELRILAHMSGDERLIAAYGEAQDIHAITASQVFHVPLNEVTPLQRRNAKAVNFGIVYGISAFGLSEGLSISQKEAKVYIENYFETYPGVKAFLDKQVADGKEHGYVTTLYGRRRPIPELKDANFMRRQFGERVAMNSPIQGTAADVMKIAMIAVDKELRARGMKSRIVLQVHDELLVEAARDEAAAVTEILETKMKGAASLRVSLEVEAHAGETWFDAK